MRNILFMGIGAVALAACASNSTFEHEYPQTLQGIVTSKIELSQEDVRKKLNDLQGQRLVGTVIANMISMHAGLIEIPVGDLSADTTQYEVELDNGGKVQVLNQFAGFNVGECVNVFLSENWKRYPPRMAYSTTDCVVKNRINGADSH
jgi:hypothetical protein